MFVSPLISSISFWTIDISSWLKKDGDDASRSSLPATETNMTGNFLPAGGKIALLTKALI